MRLCIFEDRNVALLEPLTLTRPAFDLRCGAGLLTDRQQTLVTNCETGVLVRPQMTELCELLHPEFRVNDIDWLKQGSTVFVNARWLPPRGLLGQLHEARVGFIDDELAYAIVPKCEMLDFNSNFGDWKQQCKDSLPATQADGHMIRYPWDLISLNAQILCEDFDSFRANAMTNVAHGRIGPSEQLAIADGAEIEPYVLLDTRNGPVMIDRDVKVQAFSRIEGPCYIGPNTQIVGAKIHGGSIGPTCRVGGEFEESIIQGCSNKYHDGFLGHSYLGEWVNIAAGTQISDLRNDYGEVRVVVGEERINTGLRKVGAFIGDHTKTGLTTLLNSGTSVGAFCNLLPTGSYLPISVPSFCNFRHGQVHQRTDLRHAFHTAAKVMRRRDQELTGTHIEFFFSLYEETMETRQRCIREAEQRRWRKSI